MYILKVIGARRSVLAYHSFEAYADLREMLHVYEALGYTTEQLIVEKRTAEKAA